MSKRYNALQHLVTHLTIIMSSNHKKMIGNVHRTSHCSHTETEVTHKSPPTYDIRDTRSTKVIGNVVKVKWSPIRREEHHWYLRWEFMQRRISLIAYRDISRHDSRETLSITQTNTYFGDCDLITDYQYISLAETENNFSFCPSVLVLKISSHF